MNTEKIVIGMLLAVALLVLGRPTESGAETFTHEIHLKAIEDVECSQCHKANATEILPSRKVCLDCHDADMIDRVYLPNPASHGPVWSLDHHTFAKLNSSLCFNCHDQEYCIDCHQGSFADEMPERGNLMDKVHRGDFAVSHPIASRTDPQLCNSCHETSYCLDCHQSFAPEDLALSSHRRGFRDRALDPAHAGFDDSQCQVCHPDSVLPTHTWSREHAREARKNLASCQACHPNGDTCLKCHSARSGLGINPHPDNWDNIKNNLDRAGNGRSCRRCQIGRAHV